MGRKIQHWMISHNPVTGTDTFDLVDFIPTLQSSRVLADELEGKNRAEAKKILSEVYDRVTVVNKSIFCRNVN